MLTIKKLKVYEYYKGDVDATIESITINCDNDETVSYLSKLAALLS